MYIRFSAILPVAALAAVVSAAPTELEVRQTSQCNTGPIQCCNTTFTQSGSSFGQILGLLGIILPNVSGLVGLGCSPIGGIGATCAQQPVCCTGNTYNGLVNIGCIPIIINL